MSHRVLLATLQYQAPYHVWRAVRFDWFPRQWHADQRMLHSVLAVASAMGAYGRMR